MNNMYNAGESAKSNTVLKSKITLARNLKKVPFPCRMSNELRKSVCKKIFAAVQNSKYAGEFEYIDLSTANDLDKRILVDKGIISSEMARQNAYSAVLVCGGENLGIMLCEEEHIIINSMCDGKDLKKAYEIADDIDNVLIANMKIAFDKQKGFLSSNPMHLGNAMTASYILYLPAITAANQIDRLTAMVSKLGFSVKRMFDGNNYSYELSNNINLGISEESAIDNLTAVCDLIAEQEYSLNNIR